MLALACAMFVGVSCTPTPEGPNEPAYAVTITVDTPEVFPAIGGDQVLAYTLSSEIAGEVAWVETSAAWLSAALDEAGEYKIYLNALACDVVGEQPREATLTVGYKDAKDVVVTVKQECLPAQFAVTYSNQTPLAADAAVTILDAANQNMVWGAFTFGHSALVPSDGPMPLAAEAADPVAYAKDYLETAASPMGYGGVYLFFAQMHGYGGHLSAMAENNVINCSLYSGWGAPEEKLYLAVVGINVDPNLDLNNWVDNSSLATPVHVFEVESLPQPSVKVAKDAFALPYAAGSESCAVEVLNPYGEGSVLAAESNTPWLEVACADGQLTLTYAENPYAVARKAEVTVTYTYICEVAMWGEVMPVEVPATATVAVEQAANSTVAPLTFTITVKESHFDHILVDVVPSDLEATYVLNAISLDQFDMYYSNDWAQCCANDLWRLDEFSHTGALTDYKLAIDTQYIENWTHYVYAYGVDAAASAVTSEVTYTSVDVVNDTPTLSIDLNYEVAPGLKVVYNEDTGNYELHTPAEGGTFTVKWNIVNGVEGGVVRTNNTSHDRIYDSNSVLAGTENSYCETADWWNDAEQTITFSVNPYDPSKSSWSHYVTIYLRYYSDAEKTQSMGKAINLKIQQTAPAEGGVATPDL